MSATCDDDVRFDLGAYALGTLEPADAGRIAEHLRSCADCRAELADLAAVLPSLESLTLADIDAPHPDDELFTRISNTIDERSAARQRRRRPSRRTLLAVAAAVAVLAGGGTAIGLAASSSPSATVVSATAGSVRLHVTATDVAGGTALELAVQGLPHGERCHLVAIAEDGSQHDAGRWDASYDGVARVHETTDVARSQLHRLVLFGTDGQRLVTVDV